MGGKELPQEHRSRKKTIMFIPPKPKLKVHQNKIKKSPHRKKKKKSHSRGSVYLAAYTVLIILQLTFKNVAPQLIRIYIFHLIFKLKNNLEKEIEGIHNQLPDSFWCHVQHEGQEGYLQHTWSGETDFQGLAFFQTP